MKNKLQSTRTSFSRNFQCKKAPRWLSKFFHFGTENRADQLKNHQFYISQNFFSSYALLSPVLTWRVSCWLRSLGSKYVCINLRPPMSRSSDCPRRISPMTCSLTSELEKIQASTFFAQILFWWIDKMHTVFQALLTLLTSMRKHFPLLTVFS